MAQKTPETMETEANAKKKDPGKHLVFPGSSSHFVTVRKSLNAPERSRTNAVSPEVQQHSENGGNHGGNIEPISARYAHFSELLKEWGFTGTQLVLISGALQESGLKFVEAPDAVR